MTEPPALVEFPRREQAQRRARWAAWAALAVAVAAITTLPPVEVAGLGLVALAVLLGCRPSPVGHGIAALLALGFTLLLAAGTAGLAPIPLRADWTTIAVLLAGSGALVVAAFGPRSAPRVALGVGGLTLAAVAGTAIFVRLVGSFDLLGPRTLGAIPLGLIAATGLLGVAFLMLSWGEETLAEAYPTWAPTAVGVAGVVASVFLWRALVIREESELDRRSTTAASRAALAVRSEVTDVGQVLRQFALRQDAWTDEEAALALTQLRPDVPAATVLAVLDSSGTPRVAIPALEEAIPMARAVPVRAIARTQGRAPVVVLPIPNDTARLVIHAATCVAGACRGGVAAIVTAERLTQLAAAELSAEWSLVIGAPKGREGSTGRYDRTVPLDFGEAQWQLVARPTALTVGALRSTLPEVALILGLVLSALLSVTVRLGDRARRSARAMERMQLAAALDRATDALWEWDVATGDLSRSPHLWRYMGFDPARREHTLEEWLELIHPDDREGVLGELRAHVAGERDAFEAEYRVATPDGTWHTVVDRGRAVERDDADRALRVLGITADVTKARRSEREFREIETLTSMGRIAARVAHEINNPLAGIRNAFLLVKDAVPADHPHHRYVGAIEREVDRIATVTRGLYETYRPEREGEHTSVSTVVHDAVALLAEMNRKAQVQVETALDGVPPVVPLRGALLRQIVYNLVQNAIDASPAGGTVRLAAHANGNGLVLEVRDQGPGVPPPLRERIFEPFFTTKGTNAENSGMGLGLSMVARSVTAAGGAITVDDALEGGARFVVTLPFDEPEPGEHHA
ncbi:MAG: sensor histidine kinase [Gemmatimonadales bacterium]